MSEQVVLYYNPQSRGRIVHWMLEELGADYEIKLLDFEKGEHKSPDYLKINPMGKIPTIVHRGVVVTETAAICAYLADAYPEAGLAPKLDDPKRGIYYRWLFFGAGCFEAALNEKKYPFQKKPFRGRLGYGSFEDTMNALKIALADGFILGDQFSAADVYLCSLLAFAMMGQEIEANSVFEKYIHTCMGRPAFQRTLEQVAKMTS